MEDIGELFGSLIILSYSLTLLSFALRFGLKHLRPQLEKKPNFFAVYKKFLKFFTKNHRWFGMATVGFILVHFIVQFLSRGLSITGLIAAGTMVLQVLLGIYGKYGKPKNRIWFWIHRIIAILVAAAIFIHVA
jgi:hypothetical protein